MLFVNVSYDVRLLLSAIASGNGDCMCRVCAVLVNSMYQTHDRVLTLCWNIATLLEAKLLFHLSSVYSIRLYTSVCLSILIVF